MAGGRGIYRDWMLRVLTWDAALPACVAFIPAGVEFLLPGRRGAVESVAVILPIAAFFLRVRSGRRHIASNHCSDATRRLQFCVFCVGILPLVLIECALALSGLMPKGALFANRTDCIVWAALFSAYLLSMAVAMYPGRAGLPDDREDDPDSWSVDA